MSEAFQESYQGVTVCFRHRGHGIAHRLRLAAMPENGFQQ